jgi:hypothetical protein
MITWNLLLSLIPMGIERLSQPNDPGRSTHWIVSYFGQLKPKVYLLAELETKDQVKYP